MTRVGCAFLFTGLISAASANAQLEPIPEETGSVGLALQLRKQGP